jgi:hypothetical protein
LVFISKPELDQIAEWIADANGPTWRTAGVKSGLGGRERERPIIAMVNRRALDSGEK